MSDTRYVSRGGDKLTGVLENIDFPLKNKIVIDVGASHGGFTQVAYINGAKKIYAVDVGYGLLDYKLRRLKKIEVMERTNARELEKKQFKPVPQVGLVDVSFISLKKVLPVLFNIVTERILALVKPQFEATYREASRGGGVIKDLKIQNRVIDEIKEEVSSKNWEFIGTYPSKRKGRKGNQEYFIYYEKI
ncbi:MAG: TlyA family RNA methyltransferase [Elusimicrobiota bacterium]